MGKGDKKTKRGKIIAGSYGKRRPKKKNSNVTQAKPEAKKAAPKPKAVSKTEEKPKAKPAAKAKSAAKKAAPKAKTEKTKDDKE